MRAAKADSYQDAGRSGAISAFDPITAAFTTNPVAAAQAAHDAAFAQGYADGLAQAQADIEAATDDANKRVRRALAALTEAVDSYERREATSLVEVENEIATAALAIAEKILQRELSVAADPGREAIARALSLQPPRGNALARLNPLDAATLNLTTLEAGGRHIDVIADPSVEPGGCLLEIGSSTIDSQLSSVVANVADAIGVTKTAVAGCDPTPSRTTDSEPPIS